MKGRAILLPAALWLAAAPGRAGESPPPVDPASPGRVEAFPWGAHHFETLQDVHVSEYDPDFLWQRDFERRKQTHSGIDFVHGSLSAQELYTVRDVIFNQTLRPDRLRFRFERNEYRTYNVESEDNRIEAQVRLVGPLWVSMHGDPIFDKSRSDIGAGLLLADADWRNYADLRIRWDNVVYDDKTYYDSEYERPVRRWQGETNLEWSGLRLYGGADWEVGRRLRFETFHGSDGVRLQEGHTRRTEAKIEYGGEYALVGARHQYLAQGDEREYFEEYEDPEFYRDDYRFVRSVRRADLYADGRAGPWRGRAQIGRLNQQENARMATEDDYAYRRRQTLFGARIHFLGLAEGLQIGMGYWGNFFHIDRTVYEKSPEGPFPPFRGDRERRTFADKVDLVIRYDLSELARAEALVSQEFTDGTFGGGSARVLVLF